MRIIVAGSREFRDYKFMREKLDTLFAKIEKVVILSGHCHGADIMGETYAYERGFTYEIYRPDYPRYGSKKAPLMRNQEMVDKADALAAFWVGNSPGTADVIRRARAAGLKVKVFKFEGEK